MLWRRRVFRGELVQCVHAKYRRVLAILLVWTFHSIELADASQVAEAEGMVVVAGPALAAPSAAGLRTAGSALGAHWTYPALSGRLLPG